MTDERKGAYFSLLLTFTLWGSLYVVSRFVLGKLGAFTISFFRFTIAFLTLSLFLGKNRRPLEKGDGKYVLLIGGAGYFLAVGAQLLGTRFAGASLASLINSLNPVTMTLFGFLILGESLNLFKVLGIALAIAGTYLILGGGAASAREGIILSLFAVLLWSLVSVLTRRISKKYPPLQLTRDGVGGAAVLYLPLAVAEITLGQTGQVDLSCVLALLYLGSVCTGVAYFLWNHSLSVLEAGVCSAFYPVQPLVSSLLGVFLLGEHLDASFFLGAVLILSGVLLGLLLGGRRASKKAPKLP
ncbi:MAG: EamA family transporter [Blautia sp.]|nr:EamA family transporter [Blautia sp.]